MVNFVAQYDKKEQGNQQMEMNESIQMILARVFVSGSWLSSEITPPVDL